MTYHTLTDCLRENDAAAAVLAHARLLRRLQSRFETAVPAALAAASLVANYKSGKLIIHTGNGAVAAKLRQMERRICDDLSKSGAQCSGIEVKVQPQLLTQITNQSTSSEGHPISRKASDSLTACMDTLPQDSPLRAALATLLARADIH